jgi:predicted  nucleic acid-binding Zn-ribbon protein
MMRRLVVVIFVLSLGAPGVLAAPEASAPELVDDVAGIRQALDKLVVLLETAQHNQRVELLLKRIELRERRLAPLEKRLAGAQSDVEGLEGERLHMEGMREQEEQELDEALRTGKEDHDSIRRMLKEIDRMQAGMEARLDEARMRTRRFEDQLADGREEVEILDEILLELLDAD